MANVGTADRVIRAILGVILILVSFLPVAAPFLAPLGAWKLLLAAAGLVLLATAAMRFCPLYTILGLRTCPVERR